MKINLIAIGTKMPDWVRDATQDYLKRMPQDYQVIVHEITAIKRHKQTDITAALTKEGDALFSKCAAGTISIALDRIGRAVSTIDIAEALKAWHDLGQDINLLIGGPEGIPETHLKKAQHCWSLSKLTLPHPLVRVLVAEQFYRAHSIIKGHPYHR